MKYSFNWFQFHEQKYRTVGGDEIDAEKLEKDLAMPPSSAFFGGPSSLLHLLLLLSIISVTSWATFVAGCVRGRREGAGAYVRLPTDAAFGNSKSLP